MKRRILGTLVAATVMISAVVASSASAQAPERGRSTYIVVFKNGVDAKGQAESLRKQGHSVRSVYEHVFSGVAVDLPPTAAQAMARNRNVAIVEPEMVVTATGTQTGATWGLDRSDQRNRPLNSTYNYLDQAGQGVRIYIVDTGVRSTHADLTGRVTTGYSVYSGGTEDCNGHGTHVAGSAAGSTYGIAKKATIVPVRILSCTGSGSSTTFFNGVNWILANKGTTPGVVNMSLAFSSVSSTVNTAIRNLHNSGLTTVVAAGNSNANACRNSPSSEPLAITVGSTTSSDARSSFSNFGSCVDIFAPGTNITSAWHTSNTAINTISGTSMASPHVAGAAALLLGANNGLSSAGVWSALLANATPGLVTSPGTGSPNRLLYIPSAPPLSITTASLPEADLDVAYTATIAQSGAVGTPTWSATGLPAGLGIDASGGVISGTPTAVGRSTVTVSLSTATQTASKQFTLDVLSPVSIAGSTTLPDATQYVAYTATLTPPLTVSGGLGGSYVWTATSALPAGLTLTGSTISGTPSVFGNSEIGLNVTSGGESASTTVFLTIAENTAPPLGAFSKSLPLNNSTNVSRNPALRWTTSANAVAYEVCLQTSSDMTSCTWRNVGNVTQYSWPSQLSRRTNYRWEVRAKNSFGTTLVASGGTWSFWTRR